MPKGRFTGNNKSNNGYGHYNAQSSNGYHRALQLGEVSDRFAIITCANLAFVFAQLTEYFQNTDYTFTLDVEIHGPALYDPGHDIFVRVRLVRRRTTLIFLNTFTILEYIRLKINYYEARLVDVFINAISDNTDLESLDNVTELIFLSDEVIDNICQQLIEVRENQPTYMRNSLDFRTWLNQLRDDINLPLNSIGHLPFPEVARKQFGPIAGIQILFSLGSNFEQMNLLDFIHNVLPEIIASDEDIIYVRVWKLTFSGKMRKHTQSIHISKLEQWLHNASKWSNTINVQLVSGMLEDEDDLITFPFPSIIVEHESVYVIKFELGTPDEVTFTVEVNGCNSVSEVGYKIGGPYTFPLSYMVCYIGDNGESLSEILNSNNCLIRDELRDIQEIIKTLQFTISR